MSDLPQSSEDADTDYEPQPSSSRRLVRARGVRGARGMRRPTGRSSRGRSRGRLADLSQEDVDRVQHLQAQRLASERARIQRLDLNQCHQLLERCLTREPSLIFDLLEHTPDPPLADQPVALPPHPEAPSWCVCMNCREMPTLLERKCCGQQQQHCISILPHMDLYIIQEGVLRLARRIWNDVRAEEDAQEVGESHRQFRYAAYRQFVVWQYGVLGPGHRIVLPSCCVWRIRDRFPDANGNYVGFIPTRV